MEREKEILAKLQGLEEQVEISTRLIIAFVIASQFQGHSQSLRIRNHIDKIVSEKGKSIYLMSILNALDYQRI